jgi:hypothetical protein
MGKVYDAIDAQLTAFIEAQHMFFVATAPLSGDGRVNLSPKGLDSFLILGPHQVAYLDLTGSGVETVAHVRENGRLTLMFCALEGAPKILRLYGRGRVVVPGDDEFDALIPRFSRYTGARALIVLDVARIADSCGFGVPKYVYEGERDTLTKLADARGEEALATYRRQKNGHSIDGLEGL